MGISGRIAVPLLVAPGSPTGPVSSPGTLWLRPEVCKSGYSFFEIARFTRKYYFILGTLGVFIVILAILFIGVLLLYRVYTL